MPFKNLDIENVMRRLAEKRIEDAMAEGKFDNLPGAGKPLNLEPIPADENARMLWWAIRILRGNNVMPDEVIWRKRIDALKAELAETRCEQRLAVLVQQINTLVYKLNTLGTNAIQSAVAGVELETERRRLQQRLAD